MMRKTITLIVLLAFCAAAKAQDVVSSDAASVVMPFSRMPRTASGFAMGGTVNLENPAARSLAEGNFDANLSYARLSGVFTDDVDGCIGARIKGKFYLAADFAYDRGAEISGFRTSDYLMGLGLGYAFNEHLSLGAHGRFLSSALASDVVLNGFCADLMAGVRFGGFIADVGVKELGGKVEGYSLPASLSAGAAYSFDLAPKNSVELKADVDYYFYGDLSAGAGLQYSWNRMVMLRAGYHAGGVVADFLSAGAGLSLKGLSLDVTYLATGTLGGSIIAGLGYRF